MFWDWTCIILYPNPKVSREYRRTAFWCSFCLPPALLAALAGTNRSSEPAHWPQFGSSWKLPQTRDSSPKNIWQVRWGLTNKERWQSPTKMGLSTNRKESFIKQNDNDPTNKHGDQQNDGLTKMSGWKLSLIQRMLDMFVLAGEIPNSCLVRPKKKWCSNHFKPSKWQNMTN